MKMKKAIPLLLFLLMLLIIAIIAGVYTGGYAALRSSGTNTSMLTWHTFSDVINNLSGDARYKKIVGFTWLGFAVPVVIWLGFTVLMLVALLPKKVLFGDARLATDRDLIQSGFFPEKNKKQKPQKPAIILGKMPKGRYKGKYIHYHGQQFLILYAPTRSGKGVSIVVPNLINYPDSVIVLDIKLENFFLTAGWRKKFSECYLFCPAGYADTETDFRNGAIKSHRWNPMDYVSRNSLQRQTDLRIIAGILYPMTGGENDVWSGYAIDLFIALGLYLLDKEIHYKKTNARSSYIPEVIVSIAEILKTSVPDTNEDLAAWMAAKVQSQNSFLSNETIWYFKKYISTPDKTRGSIFNTFASEISIFSNPVTAAATNHSDFDIRDVRKKKMSIWLGLNPRTLISHAKLVNLFFSMLVYENAKELPENNPALKYQCLAVLDEFTSMGRVDIIQKAAAFTAGYDLRFIFILQNLGQLTDSKMYGKEGAESFIENTGVEIFFPPKTVNEVAKTISEKIGNRDEKLRKKSTSTGQSSSRTTNFDVVERAVLLPEEIVTLREEKNKAGNMAVKEIIFSDYCRPFIADKIVYFEDPVFAEKVKEAKKNRVAIPELFSEEKKRAISAELALTQNSVMTAPDLEHHNREENL